MSCLCEYLTIIEWKNERMFAQIVHGVDELKEAIAENEEWNKGHPEDDKFVFRAYRVEYTSPGHEFLCLHKINIDDLR